MPGWGCPLAETWLCRPGLEYQRAFDLCAAQAQRCGGPAVLRASSPFHARELMKRIEALHPALVAGGGTDEELADLLGRLGPEVEVAQAWSVSAQMPVPGRGCWAETAGDGGLGSPRRRGAAVAVWAEPEVRAGDRTLASLGRALAPGGRLCVVTSGPLRRGLPEWNGEGDPPARDPAGLRRTRAWLGRAGFSVEAVYGFHGPRSLAWGAISRFPAALGREDWVDRCYAAMRQAYVVDGWQAHWAPVAVVVASRDRSRG